MNQTPKLFLTLIGVIIASSIGAFAQVTTSSIAGRVHEISATQQPASAQLPTQGQQPAGTHQPTNHQPAAAAAKPSPVPGAVVTVIHEASGSKYYTTTGNDGLWRINGLAPGGPYTVTAEMLGYHTTAVQDIYISLGDIATVDLTLQEESLTLDAAVSTAESGSSNMNVSRAGAVTDISQRRIQTTPNTTRALNDILKLTPQSSVTPFGLAVGGANYRGSYVTVDGAAFNNAFGIGSNLPAAGSPISMDALEQMTVNITPYDVRQSGFTGGAINAVTKSGSNQWHASVYNYYSSEKLTGRYVGSTRLNLSPALENTTGATVSGPIVKDRLFFFVNFEYSPETTPSTALARSSETEAFGSGSQFNRPTTERMNEIAQYLKTTYGYDPGPYQNYSLSEPDWKLLARIDWHINDSHRLNLRYSQTMDKTAKQPSSAISPLASSVYNRSQYGRTSDYAMYFRNSNYYQEQNFLSLSAELNSRFLDGALGNLLRLTWSHQMEPRTYEGKLFPTVDILENIDADGDGVAETPAVYTSFGMDPYTYGNLRDVHTVTLTDEVSIIKGINNITVGAQMEWDLTKNGYMQGGSGYYVYNSWDDFVSGAKPRAFAITHPNNNSLSQEFPSFTYLQASVYAQDELDISDRFKLTAGLRLELPFYPEVKDNYNEEFTQVSQNSTTFKGMRTYQMPRATVNISPRVGFNWDILGDRRLVLRGGSGIYTGRIPFVWIVSSVLNSNCLQAQYIDNDGTGSLTPGFHTSIADILQEMYGGEYRQRNLYAPAAPTILDTKLKMPSAWKSSLALDALLPGGIKASVEGIYSKDLTTVKAYRLGQIREAMLLPGEPSERALWTTEGIVNSNGSVINPYYLTNSDLNGWYASVTAQLSKSFGFGLDLSASYTFSESMSIGEGWGDQVSSIYNALNYGKDGSNVAELGHSGFVPPHRVIAGATYRLKEGRIGTSTFSLFYEGYNYCYVGVYGYSRMSWTIGNQKGYALAEDYGNLQTLYIPTPEELAAMPFSSPENKAAYEEFIASDRYLSGHRGQYLTRGAIAAPWQSRINFKFTQDFYIPAGKMVHTLQLGLDIDNVANLLCRNWGLTDAVTSDNVLRYNNSTGQYTYMPQTWSKYAGTANTWKMMLSLRYSF